MGKKRKVRSKRGGIKRPKQPDRTTLKKAGFIIRGEEKIEIHWGGNSSDKLHGPIPWGWKKDFKGIKDLKTEKHSRGGTRLWDVLGRKL